MKDIRPQKRRLTQLTKEMIRVIGHNSTNNLSAQTKAKGVYISPSSFQRWSRNRNDLTRLPSGDILARLEVFLNLQSGEISEFLEGDSRDLKKQIAVLLSNYEGPQSSMPTTLGGILLYIKNHATLSDLVTLLREVTDRIARFAVDHHRVITHEKDSPLLHIIQDWCDRNDCGIDDAVLSLQETYGMSEPDVSELLAGDRQPTEEEVGILCLFLKADDGRPTSAESLLAQLKGACHVHS